VSDETPRLVWAHNGYRRADVARIVEAVNGLVEVAREHAARRADAKRRGAAKERITLALESATPEQCEALAAEIEARAPTFAAGKPTSWNVQIDGNNQCFRPCSADEARATYVHWRAKLAADYAVECADAAEDGDPKPKPPTLELVVEVVVDRWEP
jgi:hypothetical protein